MSWQAEKGSQLSQVVSFTLLLLQVHFVTEYDRKKFNLTPVKRKKKSFATIHLLEIFYDNLSQSGRRATVS